MLQIALIATYAPPTSCLDDYPLCFNLQADQTSASAGPLRS